MNKNYLSLNKQTLDWLLTGDASIKYQTKRDLLNTNEAELKKLQLRISKEGWGKQFLQFRNKSGYWGKGLYMPKWTSTHYTLLNLKNLSFPKENNKINESVSLVLNSDRAIDGGISYSWKNSDVCVNGMILNFGAYFLDSNIILRDIADFLLHTQMSDGGWNCNYKKGATHSSLHSTLSVLEGLSEYTSSGNTYKTTEIGKAIKEGIEFLLVHHLFKSHRTGKIIDPNMVRFSYPSYWRYDILRALDYLQSEKIPYDNRIEDALTVLLKKQTTDGRWKLQSRYAGLVYFDMEKPGEVSRWNTLRALRIMKRYA
jgi:hypothetical protein